MPGGKSSSLFAESPDLLERSTGPFDELLLLLLLRPFVDDINGDVDEEEEDVDDDDERGGDVVVVGILGPDGDRVRAIFAGGGAPSVWPKIECGNSSLGPKFGFKMLSIENGSARRAGNGLLMLLLLCGELMGLGKRGCDNMGYAAKGRKG